MCTYKRAFGHIYVTGSGEEHGHIIWPQTLTDCVLQLTPEKHITNSYNYLGDTSCTVGTAYIAHVTSTVLRTTTVSPLLSLHNTIHTGNMTHAVSTTTYPSNRYTLPRKCTEQSSPNQYFSNNSPFSSDRVARRNSAHAHKR